VPDVTPEVSVVIPVRDGERSLPALLESLAAQELDDERYEVVVVDNGSRDRTGEVAASYGARVISDPRPNRSRARNAGAAAARADLLAFIDADCRATPRWLPAMLECRGRAPLVAGRVEIATRPEPNVIERFEARWRFHQERAVSQGWAATANLLVERGAFEAVGGLDTTYRHIGEDVDFCLRAGRAGYGIAFCHDALVLHEAEHELRPVLRRAFFHGYSAAQVLRRLGVGHVAWHNPGIMINPRAALGFYGIDSRSLPPRERRLSAAIALSSYASRVAGSVWASVVRAR
jgi:glycosyltransferase involved in cell wall biosynthesis